MRDNEDSGLICNDIPLDTSSGLILSNTSQTVSNWSIAEEIKRLIAINSIVPIEPDYNFHKIVKYLHYYLLLVYYVI